MPPPPKRIGTTPELPGSYKFNDCTLISQIGKKLRIDALFTELNIYENLASPVISGDITIVDTLGLYNNFPIVGSEQFDLNFNSQHDGTTEKKEFSRSFQTYKITDKIHFKQNFTQYKVLFATPEFEENMKTRVSKAYNGKKGSEIVRLLLTEDAPRGLGFTPTANRKLNIEESFYAEDMIIPYWKPFAAINYVAARTLANENHKAANYVFFENRDGFNFVSIESLLKKPPKFTYHKTVKNKDERLKYVFGVENYVIYDNQNIVDNINTGLYAGNLLIHDIARKSMKKVTYDYLAQFGETSHVDNHPLAPTVSDRNQREYSHYKYFPSHFNLFDNMAEGGNRADKWMLQRGSLLSQLSTFKVVIKVKGNTEIQVGDTCNFKLQMQDPTNPKEYVPDKYHSGKYLVTAIKHTINIDEYYQTIELIKDSYSDRLA